MAVENLSFRLATISTMTTRRFPLPDREVHVHGLTYTTAATSARADANTDTCTDANADANADPNPYTTADTPANSDTHTDSNGPGNCARSSLDRATRRRSP